ncbi:MAG: SCP2 sterol-binding domain-containing protein [Ilumatobacter sp.]
MSQVYADAADFEALFTQMFDQIESDDPDAMNELVDQQMVIRFKLKSPGVELWIDGRSKPVHASFGTGRNTADLTAELSANSLHELLLGTLGLAQGLLFRKIKVRGDKGKAMKLESLLHAMQTVYPDLVSNR